MFYSAGNLVTSGFPLQNTAKAEPICFLRRQHIQTEQELCKAPKNQHMFCIQCGVVTTRSICLYGVSFVSLNSDLYSVSVCAAVCAISSYIGPRYNRTWLYLECIGVGIAQHIMSLTMNTVSNWSVPEYWINNALWNYSSSVNINVYAINLQLDFLSIELCGYVFSNYCFCWSSWSYFDLNPKVGMFESLSGGDIFFCLKMSTVSKYRPSSVSRKWMLLSGHS